MAPRVTIELQGVGRRFGRPEGPQREAAWLFRALDFALAEGDFVCLVGPSGSGKTTLMRLLAGLDAPDQGQRLTPSGEPRTAMVFQEPRLVPWLTSLENLLLISGRDQERQARDLMRLMELEGSADQYPAQLSGGMQRRLSLARALLVGPHLLLLDEPLVSLDPALEERIGNALRQYWLAHRPSTVMVTHDPRQVARLATRVIGLAAGQAGLALDETLGAAAPGNRTSREEDAIVQRLLGRYPALSIAS